MNIHVADTDLERTSVVAGIEHGFDFLSAEYEKLFQRSGATAFQRPLWLHSIYAVLAPKLGAEHHVIAVRQLSTGKLVMVIPLVVQKSFGVSVLQPADFGVCDYNCIVAEPETIAFLCTDQNFLGQVRHLLQTGDVLIFRKVKETPADTAAILGLCTRSLNENSAFDVDLEGNRIQDWQREKLKKRFRSGINRRLRKLNSDHGSVQFVTFLDPAKIEAAIRFIAKIRSARFRDDILGHEAYLEFYIHYALAGAHSGEAITSGLIVDGDLISADFGIVGDNVYHSVLCAARLAEYGHYAPGQLALMELIKKRHQLGEIRFDFGIGKSRQKMDFAATEHHLYNLTMATSLRGKLISMIYNRAKPLKTFLRKRLVQIR